MSGLQTRTRTSHAVEVDKTRCIKQRLPDPMRYERARVGYAVVVRRRSGRESKDAWRGTMNYLNDSADRTDVIIRKDVNDALCAKNPDGVNAVTGNPTAMTLFCN